jgi:hypothetical protein
VGRSMSRGRPRRDHEQRQYYSDASEEVLTSQGLVRLGAYSTVDTLGKGSGESGLLSTVRLITTNGDDQCVVMTKTNS